MPGYHFPHAVFQVIISVQRDIGFTYTSVLHETEGLWNHGHGRGSLIWVVEGLRVGFKVRLKSAILSWKSCIKTAGAARSDLRREDRYCGETLLQ
jgi:hypothetical protein